MALSAVDDALWRGQLVEISRQDDAARQAECRPPSHETVEWHITQVVEAYLPSHAAVLDESLRRTGWGRSAGAFGRPREVAPALRETAVAGGWTSLTTLTPGGAPDPLAPLAQRVPVPDGVAAVSLELLSITSSLTLLSATFIWDDV